MGAHFITKNIAKAEIKASIHISMSTRKKSIAEEIKTVASKGKKINEKRN